MAKRYVYFVSYWLGSGPFRTTVKVDKLITDMEQIRELEKKLGDEIISGQPFIGSYTFLREEDAEEEKGKEIE